MPCVKNTEFNLYDHQKEALGKLHSGAILFGDVGSGKTLTGLAFYLKHYSDRDLYVVTTAKKRDSGDWEEEASLLGINNLVVDSWNNIRRYGEIRNAFFIFDEQRVVGSGAWSKYFIRIGRTNEWILLSGTPGDTWMDYIPVFLANRYYKNKTEFIHMHVEYDRMVKFPKVKRYHNEGILLKLRQEILVPMRIVRTTKRVKKMYQCEYDKDVYKRVMDERWNVFTDAPIETPSELAQTLRRVVAEHPSRIHHAKWVMGVHDKVIVFYNYNYELEILLDICRVLNKPYGMWNGRRHDQIPDTSDWIYLVQYTAGAEGWNCTSTNVLLFYSMNYSYRITEQSEGRIDRINTKHTDLEYFYLLSSSRIDKAVRDAIQKKKTFNESALRRW